MKEKIKEKMNFKINIFASSVDKSMGCSVENDNLRKLLDMVTKAVIERALMFTSGNKCKAAQMIGINRNTLSAHFKQFPHLTRQRLDGERTYTKN